MNRISRRALGFPPLALLAACSMRKLVSYLLISMLISAVATAGRDGRDDKPSHVSAGRA